MLNEYNYNLTVLKNGINTFFEKVEKDPIYPIIDQSIKVRNIIAIMDCTYNMCDGTKDGEKIFFYSEIQIKYNF